MTNNKTPWPFNTENKESVFANDEKFNGVNRIKSIRQSLFSQGDEKSKLNLRPKDFKVYARATAKIKTGL